jgi:hypothetical protein
MECLTRVVQLHVDKHGNAPSFIVVVGGTAMAARGIRTMSAHVDYYSPDIDEDVVHSVETEMKSRFGRDFKIDATPGENLWGPILFRDIAQSGQVTVIKSRDVEVPVKALSAEDLVLVKIAADRRKDQDDLPLLAPAVEVDALVERFNKVIGWHGDRSAVMAYADRFLEFLSRHKNAPSGPIIVRMAIPDYVKEMLIEARAGDDHP